MLFWHIIENSTETNVLISYLITFVNDFCKYMLILNLMPDNRHSKDSINGAIDNGVKISRISRGSMSFSLIECSGIAVEVKKEPEPPTEVVKQEEREPATKSSAPAPPSKPPPEKRARLQWFFSHILGRWRNVKSCSTNWENSLEYSWSLFALLIWSFYKMLRMIWHQKGQSVACLSARTTFTL